MSSIHYINLNQDGGASENVSSIQAQLARGSFSTRPVAIRRQGEEVAVVPKQGFGIHDGIMNRINRDKLNECKRCKKLDFYEKNKELCNNCRNMMGNDKQYIKNSQMINNKIYELGKIITVLKDGKKTPKIITFNERKYVLFEAKELNKQVPQGTYEFSRANKFPKSNFITDKNIISIQRGSLSKEETQTIKGKEYKVLISDAVITNKLRKCFSCADDIAYYIDKQGYCNGVCIGHPDRGGKSIVMKNYPEQVERVKKGIEENKVKQKRIEEIQSALQLQKQKRIEEIQSVIQS